MSLKSLLSGGVVLLLLGVAAVVAPAHASHIDSEARREQRRLEREARRAAEENVEPACSCSASLRLARPSLHFGNAGLVFIPRVDVSVRGRGEADAPGLDVAVNYEGGAQGMAFNGTTNVLAGAACNGRYSFGGLKLARVVLPGLGFGALDEDEKVDGLVKLKASLVGCGFEEEHKQFGFTREGFGELQVGSWRSVR